MYNIIIRHKHTNTYYIINRNKHLPFKIINHLVALTHTSNRGTATFRWTPVLVNLKIYQIYDDKL